MGLKILTKSVFLDTRSNHSSVCEIRMIRNVDTWTGIMYPYIILQMEVLIIYRNRT